MAYVILVFFSSSFFQLFLRLVPIKKKNVFLYLVKNTLKRKMFHTQHFYNMKFIVIVLRKYYEYSISFF